MRVDYHVADGIGRIVLSNPPQNTLRRPNFADPASELQSFLERSELKAVILTGEGKHFSAGADLESLEELRADEAALEKALDEGKETLSLITHATVPVVAMIRGSCLGAGLEIALACHFRIASKNAMLGFPEATLGLIPGLGGTVTTPEVLPRRFAIDLMVSGRTLDGAEALDIGLVDEISSTRKLEQTTIDFVNRLVGRRPTHIIRAVMESIHNARTMPREQALREEGRLFLKVSRAISHIDSAERGRD